MAGLLHGDPYSQKNARNCRGGLGLKLPVLKHQNRISEAKEEGGLAKRAGRGKTEASWGPHVLVAKAQVGGGHRMWPLTPALTHLS